MSKNIKLGATGEFPRGKLTETDEGALRLAVGIDKNTVVIAFGKPVAWIGLPKGEALQFASLIKKHAESL